MVGELDAFIPAGDSDKNMNAYRGWLVTMTVGGSAMAFYCSRSDKNTRRIAKHAVSAVRGW